jgi:hypothetical protein
VRLVPEERSNNKDDVTQLVKKTQIRDVPDAMASHALVIGPGLSHKWIEVVADINFRRVPVPFLGRDAVRVASAGEEAVIAFLREENRVLQAALWWFLWPLIPYRLPRASGLSGTTADSSAFAC